MVTMPDIDRLMAGSLGQFLTAQAEARAEAKAKAWSRVWRSAILVGPLVLAAAVLLPLPLDVKLWGSGLITMGIWYWTQGPVREAKRRVKIGINEGIAAALGLTYTHDGEEGREFALSKQYRLLPGHDRHALEDFWSGTLEEHDFLLHEAHLEEQRGSGKNRRWVTVFRGAIIRIAAKRRFHGTTLVQRAGKHRKFLGLGGRKDNVEFDGHRLDTVDMVHPDFDDTFEVWSDDQVEARYLVHPRYVEQLLAIEAAFDGQDIRSLFTAGDIIVVVGSGNMFEGGTMNPASDREMVERCAQQFASLGRLAQMANETRTLEG
ncbi:DUF3137 domain-containing protein [Erythrobacter sp. SDW2]|uniref:DUF3137 domain-containing protein n=1 Tax=Erythrobacter sp. SDW2 TaxID=2907154 RepID=UPI001F363A26|nr:DUF3137 domain-containing protein [Erythrobacter sp. SDW2]UIP06040.1 DUF3137 domain-containing protein [Erythrobacter sp. SDW2]